jgi:redox-sensitive bicupin YhaK (pirin superfamily)
MTLRRVDKLVPATATSDGAGVRLGRTIGGPGQPNLDPFLLLDEFASDDSADYIAGFPDHPHRGFETVTYMLDGRMRHQDNTGEGGSLVPGGVQWMTAGRGIVHSEMPEQEEGLMRGFQLWVNLPAADKMCAPRYQNLEPEQIPEVAREGGARIRVIAGAVDGVAGPVDGISVEPLYLDVSLPAGGATELAIAPGHTAFAYAVDGEVEVVAEGGGATSGVAPGVLAVLSDGDALRLGASEGAARALVIAGRPIGEPIARYGPFVMNTREEIIQAFADFQAGRF